MKSAILLPAALLSTIGALNATVLIQFNAPFSGGVSSSLANTAGVVTNGMTYGIMVDGGTTPGFLATYNGLTSGALISGVTTTDDYFFPGTDLTNDAGQGGTVLEGDFVTTGGNGGVTAVNFSLTGPVTAGKSFLLVWLSGTSIGTLSDASFVIPADGNTVTLDAPFVGEDPIRKAGIAYTGTVGGSTTSSGISIVPEPSAALLGAIGVLGLLRRRRI